MSDYVVCYLRILTSGHLQTHSQFFQEFVEGGKTMKEYCSQVILCNTMQQLLFTQILKSTEFASFQHL